jgi:hypothetical protein
MLIGMAKPAIDYNCFFCDEGIAETDPERLDLIVKPPELTDLTRAVWYACHQSCLDCAEGQFGTHAKHG